MADRRILAGLLGLGLFFSACASGPPREPAGEGNSDVSTGKPTPDRVIVQYLLVAFRGAPGFRHGEFSPSARQRTREEARILGHALFERARSGVDFVELMTQGDEPGGATLALSNHRVMQVQGDVSRFSVGSALGNRAFSLGVDEVGLVAFDPVASPYGWYVVKRVE